MISVLLLFSYIGNGQDKYTVVNWGPNNIIGLKEDSYSNLNPRDYKLEIQASNGYHEWEQSQKVLFLHISPAFWNTNWFWILVVVSIFTLSYLIINLRLKQKIKIHTLKNDLEKQLMVLRQRSTDLELKALRAQINPHFIFNCLNSINRFIMLNEPEVAADYLTKFARLIRHVLNNSQESSISLEDELESLELFLQMEKLRFNDGFQYTIHCQEDVDKAEIYIPPMLLQPFAENAIWHGLMHKKEPGHLSVEIGRENEHLICVITDDGVGRKKAEENKTNFPGRKKSYGLQLTSERLLLWNSKMETTSYLEITDLEDEFNQPMGTRITLRIRYVESKEFIQSKNTSP